MYFGSVRAKRDNCLSKFDDSKQNLQLNYVRMPEEFEVLNLPADFAYNIKAANLLPIQDLHGNFMSS